MFTLLLDLVKNIVEIAQKQHSINMLYKENISKILNEISDVLNDTAEKLNRDEYPHMNCATLNTLSTNFEFYVSDLIPKEQLENLSNCLKEASHVEKLFALRKEAETILDLKKAAGEFRAFAIIILM